ncbi:MAG: DUF6171 family protein [Massiliimalia sp.]|jgi:hypothetical protein
MEQRICKHCLLKEWDPQMYEQVVADYLASLDPDCRTDPEEYTSRLNTCQSCDRLFQGMCRICGCFVEVRAAKKQNRCPHTPSRW